MRVFWAWNHAINMSDIYLTEILMAWLFRCYILNQRPLTGVITHFTTVAIMLMLDECYAYFIRKCLAFRFGKGSACNEAQHNHS